MRKPILAAATAALVALSCSHNDSTRDARPMTRAEFVEYGGIIGWMGP